MNLDSENYDFDNSGISKSTYYNHLDKINNLNYVRDIRHSLSLNSIKITISDINKSTNILTELHNDILLEYIEIVDDTVQLDFSTTKWLCTEQELKDYYPGEYSDKAIACTYAELIQKSWIKNIHTIGSKELYLIVDFEPCTKTSKFTDILSTLGYSIIDFNITNNLLTDITIMFDESMVFNDTEIQYYKKNKYRQLLKEKTKNSEPIE